MAEPAQPNIRTAPLRPKTRKAAECHERVFSAMMDKLAEIDVVTLSVFVCGPSEDSDPVASKKVDIVNALRERGHDAFTGEEVVEECTRKDQTEGKQPQRANVYEKAAALAADLVILLRSSFGPIAEFSEFLQSGDICGKLRVFVDKAHASSYSSGGALGLYEDVHRKADYYTAEDIQNCTVRARTLEIVRNAQTAKWCRGQGGAI